MYCNSKLIDFDDIYEEIVEIYSAKGYYITPSGKIYRKIGCKYYPFKTYRNKSNYMYANITVNKVHKTFRVHKLVANAYIPNPNNYPIVGHCNNIKYDNCVLNLYWTTYSENTQKAVDDGLLKNAVGVDDSQSIQIVCLDKNFMFICTCGSISIASRRFNVSKSTISRHIEHKIKGKTRCGYYFRTLEEYKKFGLVL